MKKFFCGILKSVEWYLDWITELPFFLGVTIFLITAIVPVAVLVASVS